MSRDDHRRETGAHAFIQPPFAYGGPPCRGVIRSVPEDFRVDEIPSVTPDGQGEHLLLHIEKRGSNTDWVAGLLARHAGVPRGDVSYAGLKDRHAVTRQWFSVRLAGRDEPRWEALEGPDLRVIERARHSRKLRTGALRGNRFDILIRSLDGDRESLAQRLEAIREGGIPNYFGEQRFGRQGSNLRSAEALFAGRLGRVSRQKRGLYISAARSMLFNCVLAERVSLGNWNRPLDGERLILDGSRSSFVAERVDDEIQRRFFAWDVHTSGPLWGSGTLGPCGEAAAVEEEALAPFAVWREGLERLRLEMERRPLRARAEGLTWTETAEGLRLGFALPRGSYATAVLRELISWQPGS